MGDTLYVSSLVGTSYIIDTVNNRKFIACPDSSIKAINKQTKVVTTIDISSSAYSVISSTGSTVTRYIISSGDLSECVLYGLQFVNNSIR